MTTRRSFIASILAAGFAPAAIGSGVLMPVRKIVAPPLIEEMPMNLNAWEPHAGLPRPVRSWFKATREADWVDITGQHLPQLRNGMILTSMRVPAELSIRWGFLVCEADKTSLTVSPAAAKQSWDFTQSPRGQFAHYYDKRMSNADLTALTA